MHVHTRVGYSHEYVTQNCAVTGGVAWLVPYPRRLGQNRRTHTAKMGLTPHSKRVAAAG